MMLTVTAWNLTFEDFPRQRKSRKRGDSAQIVSIQQTHIRVTDKFCDHVFVGTTHIRRIDSADDYRVSDPVFHRRGFVFSRRWLNGDF
ncbi:hypothetical protein AV521_38245 [Streptomyces sp. IMTB 2501]|nr:hypothetical protein AV521_38245 [Streptomyces sp. IMTB 2501]